MTNNNALKGHLSMHSKGMGGSSEHTALFKLPKISSILPTWVLFSRKMPALKYGICNQ